MIVYSSQLFEQFGYNVGTTDNELDFKRTGNQFQTSVDRLTKHLHALPKHYLEVKQIHSTIILEQPYTSSSITEADGIILKKSNMIGVIRTADCLPIVLCDPCLDVLILTHVGRKGARAGIINKALNIFKSCYNSDILSLIVYLGPCLLFENHIVFEEEKEGFDTKYYQPFPAGVHLIDNQQLYDEYSTSRNISKEDVKKKKSGYFDLKSFAIDQLLEFAINKDNIDDCAINTYTHPNCHSYRRDYPNNGLSATFAKKITI